MDKESMKRLFEELKYERDRLDKAFRERCEYMGMHTISLTALCEYLQALHDATDDLGIKKAVDELLFLIG